jgi:HEAT repeat protein
MRRLAMLSLLLLAAPAHPQNTLREAVAAGSGRVAWRIQTTGVDTCCCDEGRGWTNYDRDRVRIEYRELLAVATLDGNRVRKLRVVEPNCPLNGVRRLENVTAEESIDFLLEQVGRGSDRDGQILAVISMHDQPRVVPELITLARQHQSSDVRRHALFWLGQRAGEKAAGELRRAVDEDPEDDVRQHAVFAISQLPAERAVPILIDLVKTHKRPAVRKRAMFWLAQTNDPRALDLIEEILGVR